MASGLHHESCNRELLLCEAMRSDPQDRLQVETIMREMFSSQSWKDLYSGGSLSGNATQPRHEVLSALISMHPDHRRSFVSNIKRVTMDMGNLYEFATHYKSNPRRSKYHQLQTAEVIMRKYLFSKNRRL